MPDLKRRDLFAAAGLVALGGAGAAGANWFNLAATNVGAAQLSPPDALRAAERGEIVLVDIRRPDEWAGTGIGAQAQPLDLRSPGFVAGLEALVPHRAAAIALICARGVRSRRLGAVLAERGFANILDVPEGMLGSGAGPGWLARGLPVVPWQA